MVKKEADHKKKIVTITQVVSPIGRDKSQRQTLIGLGLNKLGRTSTLVETPDVMGMVSRS